VKKRICLPENIELMFDLDHPIWGMAFWFVDRTTGLHSQDFSTESKALEVWEAGLIEWSNPEACPEKITEGELGQLIQKFRLAKSRDANSEGR
jgi:hypothetical protein